MKAIILAAGYATRLYPLTENFPKPLLQVGSNTLLGRLLDDIDGIEEITDHFIVTNAKFAPFFEQWREKTHYAKPITIVNDGTYTNETRLGAVRDLLMVITRYDIESDILVLAADNILDFSLKGFVEAFHHRGTSMLMCHYESSLDKLQRTGVISLDDDMRVLQMQEKPLEPVSHWAVPPFYIYARADLAHIRTALAHGCGSDAPGNLAHYLADVSVLHAWPMPSARLDIGSLDTYEAAKHRFGL